MLRNRQANTASSSAAGTIPLRPFGKHQDVRIPALGMGGHHLGDAKNEQTAVALVQEAVDGGITFFDNCWEYHRGKSEVWMGKGLQGRRDKVFLMTKVCARRDASLAMQMLEQSLTRLQAEYLDLWQLHGVSFENDPELFMRPGVAAEAMRKAKEQGKVRFLGFTGHKDPAMHLSMLKTGFPFDAVHSSARAGAQTPQHSADQVPKRPLGKTGVQVSSIGVGGHHPGSTRDQEANDLVAMALDAGITFFDNAWDYHDGVSEERLGNALKTKRHQAFVMTKVCTHGRGKVVAMQMLEQSLRRLQTDHLDLWQIHEVIYYNDPDLIFRPGGAAEALQEARQQGKVRFIGFTGHKDPAIHLRMLQQNFPFDTVQMPLNAFDATFRSFETQVMPEAVKRGIAVLGMKSLGGSGEMVTSGAITAHEGLRYAMSLPVATTISGMDSIAVLEQNLQVAKGFPPMSAAEMQALRDRVRIYAADGRFELFKTTKKYDGEVGREQHHFPPAEKLPA